MSVSNSDVMALRVKELRKLVVAAKGVYFRRGDAADRARWEQSDARQKVRDAQRELIDLGVKVREPW